MHGTLNCVNKGKMGSVQTASFLALKSKLESIRIKAIESILKDVARGKEFPNYPGLEYSEQLIPQLQFIERAWNLILYFETFLRSPELEFAISTQQLLNLSYVQSAELGLCFLDLSADLMLRFYNLFGVAHLSELRDQIIDGEKKLVELGYPFEEVPVICIALEPRVHSHNVSEDERNEQFLPKAVCESSLSCVSVTDQKLSEQTSKPKVSPLCSEQRSSGENGAAVKNSSHSLPATNLQMPTQGHNRATNSDKGVVALATEFLTSDTKNFPPDPGDVARELNLVSRDVTCSTSRRQMILLAEAKANPDVSSLDESLQTSDYAPQDPLDVDVKQRKVFLTLKPMTVEEKPAISQTAAGMIPQTEDGGDPQMAVFSPPPPSLSIQVQEEEVRAKLKVLMDVSQTIPIDVVNLKQDLTLIDGDGADVYWTCHGFLIQCFEVF